jgi:hypothetical protein
MQKRRDALIAGFDPANCWADGHKFMTLVQQLVSGGYELTAENLGIDFNGTYYGSDILLKAMKECPRTMAVNDEYFVYECQCVNGKPRLTPVHCRDGSYGDQMEPGHPDPNFAIPEQKQWMKCVQEADGTFHLQNCTVKEERTMITSRMPKTVTTTSTTGRRKRSTYSSYPSDGSCSAGTSYSDGEFVYYCDTGSDLEATLCIAIDDAATEMKEGERVTYGQSACLLCNGCDDMLCQVYEELSIQTVATSK